MINNWRLDKRIPIALLVTLIFQMASALIWAAQLNARVDSLENQAESNSGFGEKLARIDERVKAMKQDTDYIKQVITRISK